MMSIVQDVPTKIKCEIKEELDIENTASYENSYNVPIDGGTWQSNLTPNAEVEAKTVFGRVFSLNALLRKADEVIIKPDLKEIIAEELLQLEGKTYKCYHCGGESYKFADLRYHIKRKHLQWLFKYQCPHCCFRGTRLLNLKEHIMERHPNEQILWCPYCYYETCIPYCLQFHIKLRHIDGYPQGCYGDSSNYLHNRVQEHCKHLKELSDGFFNGIIKGTADQSALNILQSEEQRQSSGSLVSCYHCHRTFTNYVSLKFHIEEIHLKEINSIVDIFSTSNSMSINGSSQSEYICTHCSFKTRYPANLRRHIKYKHGTSEKENHCKMCDYKCMLNSDLKRHIKNRHEKEKLKQSRHPLCDQRSRRVGSLRKCALIKHGDEIAQKIPLKGSTLKKSYSCQLCNFITTYSFDLKKHMRARHKNYEKDKQEEKLYKGPFCDLRSLNETGIKKHIAAKHQHNKSNESFSQGNFKHRNCTLCEYKSTSVEDINNHILTWHQDAKPHKCTLCNYCSLNIADVKRHRIIRHEHVKPHECSLCEFRTGYSSQLKKHMRKKHFNDNYDDSLKKKQKNKLLKCEFCGRVCLSPTGLSRHRFFKHKNTDHSNTTLTNLAEKKKFSCALCDYSTKYFFVLKRHLRSMHKKKHGANDLEKMDNECYNGIKCPLCTFVSKSSNGLRRHLLRMHKQDKSCKRILIELKNNKLHKCSLCDYSSAYFFHLKKHILERHKDNKKFYNDVVEKFLSGVKPYKCSFCSYRSANSVGLKKHLLIKHQDEEAHKTALVALENEKPHKCTVCDYRSAYLGDVKRHIINRHEKQKKPLGCPMCDHRSSTHMGLRKHMLDWHREEEGFKLKYSELINEKPHKCLECDYRTGYFQDLRKHVNVKHSDNKELYEKILEQHVSSMKPFKCQLCGCRSTSSQGLRKHELNKHLRKDITMRKKEENKQHKCDLCDYSCVYLFELKRHLRAKHPYNEKYEKLMLEKAKNGELKHKCSLCSYVCLSSIGLRRHILKKHREEEEHKMLLLNHENIRLHKCSLCDYRTAYFFHLKRHMKAKHKNNEKLYDFIVEKQKADRKPHKCKLCDYRSSKSTALEKHIKAVHGNKKAPYLRKRLRSRKSTKSV